MSMRGLFQSAPLEAYVRLVKEEFEISHLGHARAGIETMDWRCPSGGSLLTEGGGCSMQRGRGSSAESSIERVIKYTGYEEQPHPAHTPA